MAKKKSTQDEKLSSRPIDMAPFTPEEEELQVVSENTVDDGSDPDRPEHRAGTRLATDDELAELRHNASFRARLKYKAEFAKEYGKKKKALNAAKKELEDAKKHGSNASIAYKQKAYDDANNELLVLLDKVDVNSAKQDVAEKKKALRDAKSALNAAKKSKNDAEILAKTKDFDEAELAHGVAESALVNAKVDRTLRRSHIKQKPELRDQNILLSVRHLKMYFKLGSWPDYVKLKAVHDVNFDVKVGETFGIVGESGCGKSTTGRSIMHLYDITSGSIYYRGYRVGAGNRWNRKEIKYSRIHAKEAVKKIKDEEVAQKATLSEAEFNKLHEENLVKISEIKARNARVVAEQKAKIKQIKYDQHHPSKKLMSEIQMIFQDPVDSLDPRMTVEDIIQEGLRIQGHHNRRENHEKTVDILRRVGLVPEHASRYPHEFSGGQRQRIGIARALIMNPKLLICDEPISALDVSIRAQVINLLNELKEEMGLTMIFIAHDLSTVKYFCDRIAVMYYGNLVELTTSDELFKHPLHPYTKSLLSAIPQPNPFQEKRRKRIVYDQFTAHDYSKQKPTLQEILPGHFILANDEEMVRYRKEIADLDSGKAEIKNGEIVSEGEGDKK